MNFCCNVGKQDITLVQALALVQKLKSDLTKFSIINVQENNELNANLFYCFQSYNIESSEYELFRESIQHKLEDVARRCYNILQEKLQ